MKGDNETLAQAASSVISFTYTQMDLYAPYADDFLDVYLQGNTTTRSLLGSKLETWDLSSRVTILVVSTRDRKSTKRNIVPVLDANFLILRTWIIIVPFGLWKAKMKSIT